MVDARGMMKMSLRGPTTRQFSRRHASLGFPSSPRLRFVLFQLRCQNYPGACESLFFGTPSPDTKGDRCRSQHLWTSLAKLANLAGEVGSEEKDADVFPAIPLNHARACKIQQQLLLAETREGLQDFLAPEAVSEDAVDPTSDGRSCRRSSASAWVENVERLHTSSQKIKEPNFCFSLILL